MKLTKENIAKIEKVGESQKGEIYHILTKGGLNIIAEKSLGGEYTILSKAGHRAFARHQASTLKKDIQWNESLFKSENPPKQEPIQHISNPDNHYKVASFYAKLAGRAKHDQSQFTDLAGKMSVEHHDAVMRELAYTDTALKHFRMSGLDGKDVHNQLEKHKQLHHELLPDQKAPFNPSVLEAEWYKNNQGKPQPHGLLYNWSE